MPHELLHRDDIAPAFKEACPIRVTKFEEGGTHDLGILRKLLKPSQ